MSTSTASGATAGKCRVYIGTYTHTASKGIYLCELDPANGALTEPKLAAETVSPSFLELDPAGRFLFAVNEAQQFQGKPTGGVSAFAVDSATGRLALLNQRSSRGTDPCHIVADREARNLLVSNYSSGSVAVFPIGRDGRLGEATAFIEHAGKGVHPDRQEGPHAHCVTLDPAGQFAFVCDLGLDKIMAYRFDQDHGFLLPHNQLALKPGAGPRHLVFHPDGRRACVINELDSTITVFDYDPGHGRLTELQTVSALPGNFKGDNTTAEVVIHPSGKFLYGSNRGHDSIGVYSIDPATGRLTPVEHQPSRGKVPRHFAIDPSGRFLLVANQQSNNLVVFRIDPATGRLQPTNRALEAPSPVCVKFMPH